MHGRGAEDLMPAPHNDCPRCRDWQGSHGLSWKMGLRVHCRPRWSWRRKHSRFATPKNPAPEISWEMGKPGSGTRTRIKLKVLADVGLVGSHRREINSSQCLWLLLPTKDWGLSFYNHRANLGMVRTTRQVNPSSFCCRRPSWLIEGA